MIKLKKLLAGVIGAAMMLTSATALASEVQKTDATIDTTKTGSLTIHKYEYNGTDAIKGTGATTDTDTVPEDATALAGAGFTIYKVANVDDLTAYYSANPTELPNVNDYVENGAIKSAYENTKVGSEQITKEDGIVEFDGLELGFYVVIETTTPDAVTKAMTPFIVSIPMTTVDGADWLYDVHVYPKNGTTYGNVELVKSGEEGALAGVTFVLQKETTDGWVNIKKQGGAAGDNTGDDLNLTTNASGIISVSGLTQGTYRFIETSVGDNNKGYIMDGKTAYEFKVNADGTVTYGEDGIPAESVTIPVKNEKPDMDKQVANENVEGGYAEAADYNVGDAVPYKITVSVPANIASLKKFAVTDTPTNLDDDNTTIVVKATKNGETTSTTLVKDTDYTVSVDGEGIVGFTINFDTSKLDGYADGTITITYNAELLSTAVTTTEGNKNTAKLEYSNQILPDTDDKDNPNYPDNPDKEPTSNTIKDDAVVYTFVLKVYKENEAHEALAGVEFDVYSYAGNETNPSETELKKNGVLVGQITTGEDGNASVTGLENGTYYLVETKTQEGYNLLKNPVAVTIEVVYKTTWTESNTYDEDGNLIKHEVSAKNETFSGAADTEGNGFVLNTVVNKKGFELPTTGGMGSIIFIVGGIALAMAGLMIILASNKRARA